MSKFRIGTLVYLLSLSMFMVVIGLAPLVKTGAAVFVLYGILTFAVQVTYLLEKPISIVLIKKLGLALILSWAAFTFSLVVKSILQNPSRLESSEIIFCIVFGVCLIPLWLIRKYLSA